jgi:hypothetical protein
MAHFSSGKALLFSAEIRKCGKLKLRSSADTSVLCHPHSKITGSHVAEQGFDVSGSQQVIILLCRYSSFCIAI